MSRTLFSTSVKSLKSFARASAASTAFLACCSNRTKNSLFLGRSDRRTFLLLLSGHILRLLGLGERGSDALRDALERGIGGGGGARGCGPGLAGGGGPLGGGG